MAAKKIIAADLFAGAGGTSTALKRVCDSRGLGLKLKAVNHWDTAVETHAKNHPEAEHVCETLDSVDPRKLFAGQKLDVLCASPECTNHSNARGGKPCDDQSRSTAWHVLRWAEALQPRVILVENVREFTDWGPLNQKTKRPVKRLKGTIFAQWLNTLRAIGYRAEWRLVNAADFGGATTRTRFFLLAVRGRPTVPWPAKTHEECPTPGLFDDPLPRWRSAAEVIDWNLPGKSIFGRKKALSPNTMKRIAEGIRRFWGIDPEPFLVALRGTAAEQLRASARSAADPVPTLTGGGEPVGGITTTSRGMGLLAPYLVKFNGTGTAYSVADPLDTITQKDRFGLVTAAGIVADVLFRMLQPHELAAAMGFPPGYVFCGNREDVVKQIGNAVEVNKAFAHLRELSYILAA